MAIREIKICDLCGRSDAFAEATGNYVNGFKFWTTDILICTECYKKLVMMVKLKMEQILGSMKGGEEVSAVKDEKKRLIDEVKQRLPEGIDAGEKFIRDLVTDVIEREPNLVKEGAAAFDGYFVHWDRILDACCQAWPGEKVGYDYCPTELIVRIIDERDELKEETAKLRRFADGLIKKQNDFRYAIAEALDVLGPEVLVTGSSPGHILINQSVQKILKKALGAVTVESVEAAECGGDSERGMYVGNELLEMQVMVDPDMSGLEPGATLRDVITSLQKEFEQLLHDKAELKTEGDQAGTNERD